MCAQIAQVIIEIGHRAWYRKKATPEKTHDWILFVRGSEGNDISHFVEKIVFNLHQSFNPPKRVLKSPPYELRESGYGEFMPMIDIYFKNKGEKGAPRKVTIQYYLNLNREDSPPIDNVRPEKLKFHNPAEEFLEKVLKAGGVILGSDGFPLVSKPRLSSTDSQPTNSQMSDSRNHDMSEIPADVSSTAKAALVKKRKQSSDGNPMSNDSSSSNESLLSRRSPKSDPLEKDSDNLGAKRKMYAALFDPVNDELSKKKKKAVQSSEKTDKAKPVEQKPVKVDPAEEGKHRSSKVDHHKHSSGKSHHRRDDSGRDHREKGTHSHSHGKPKSGDRNSRSSSRTPSKSFDKTKSSEASSGSRVHGNSSSHSGGSSTHHRSSSSNSRHHSSSKSGSSKVDSSRHTGGQSQKNESSSSRHGSSKHHLLVSDAKGDSMSRKMDVQLRLSPVDIRLSDAGNPRPSGSTRKPETSSSNRFGRSPDDLSSQKPSHLSPVKKRPNNAILPAPLGHPTPSFDINGKSYDDSTNRIRPKYDKLLDDMKSDDEEEDGEIRSPVATEPPELVPWKANSGDRKDEKPKESSSSLDRKKSSSKTSLSTTPRLEKPERYPFGMEKPSPTKVKGDWSSSEKTSPEDVSSSGLHVRAIKSHVKENVDSELRSSKKTSSSKPNSQKESISGQRTSEKTPKQTKDLPASEILSALRSETDEKDGHDFFKVESTWNNSYSKTNDVVSRKGFDSTMYGVQKEGESALYDEKKSTSVTEKSEPLKGAIYSDRAPNGELLVSLLEMKEKINRVTSAVLLNQIVDVIEAAGKLKSDDENLEFDFCQLDTETMQKVKQLLETEPD